MDNSHCFGGDGNDPSSLAMLVGPPTVALVPPGQCYFGEDFSNATLVGREHITHDTILITFRLPDTSKPLGLSTCACILAKFTIAGEPDPIVRPYTPVSTNAMIGMFQLVIKVYDQGKMSQHLNKLPIGSDVAFKHIQFNVKIQYPFGHKHLTMLVGGTGITPMVQALHAILGTPADTTSITMVFGNKTQSDILCKDLLDSWVEASDGRLKVVHVLSDADNDATWKGERGFIGRDVIQQHCAPPSEDTLVMVCGPPPMYSAVCGPRDQKELSGILNEMGYHAGQVFKF